MIGLSDIFPKHQLNDWLNQLKKELKEDAFERLHAIDPIEDLVIISNAHNNNTTSLGGTPGQLPYYRGANSASNQWKNVFCVHADSAESANKRALNALMNGADSLRFDIRNSEDLNLSALTKEIQFEYIESQWIIRTIGQWQALLDHFEQKLPKNFKVLYDHFDEQNEELFQSLVDFFKDKQWPFLHVNGFEIHEAGSSAWQEVAFCLTVGNDYLEQLIALGYSIDQATACLSFSTGVGSNYFIEIAKYRALRWAWSSIVTAYTPQHKCSHLMQIMAEIGWMNKSTKDPNTNFLRQTTEAMSAIIGGIQGLLIYPFDMHTVHGISEKSERMALTIPLILQEESLLNQVIDPAGGSYSIENLTHQIATKSWTFFQQLHQMGGLLNQAAFELIHAEISELRTKRVERLTSNKDQFIGMNCFYNPTDSDNSFADRKAYRSFEPLNLEIYCS